MYVIMQEHKQPTHQPTLYHDNLPPYKHTAVN